MSGFTSANATSTSTQPRGIQAYTIPEEYSVFDQLRAQYVYGPQLEPKDWGDAFSDFFGTTRWVPYAGDLVQMGQATQLIKDAYDLKENKGTGEQVRRMQSYLAETGRETTTGYDIWNTVLESSKFMLEFIGSGGLGKLATKGAAELTEAGALKFSKKAVGAFVEASADDAIKATVTAAADDLVEGISKSAWRGFMDKSIAALSAVGDDAAVGTLKKIAAMGDEAGDDAVRKTLVNQVNSLLKETRYADKKHSVVDMMRYAFQTSSDDVVKSNADALSRKAIASQMDNSLLAGAFRSQGGEAIMELAAYRKSPELASEAFSQAMKAQGRALAKGAFTASFLRPTAIAKDTQENRLAAILTDGDTSWMPNMAKAWGDNWVENFSEQTGGLFGTLIARFGKSAAGTWLKQSIVGNLIEKANAKAPFATKLMRTLVGTGEETSSSVAKLMGWDGVVDEMLEEYAGAALRTAIPGLENDFNVLDIGEQAKMFVSFMINPLAVTFGTIGVRNDQISKKLGDFAELVKTAQRQSADVVGEFDNSRLIRSEESLNPVVTKLKETVDTLSKRTGFAQKAYDWIVGDAKVNQYLAQPLLEGETGRRRDVMAAMQKLADRKDQISDRQYLQAAVALTKGNLVIPEADLKQLDKLGMRIAGQSKPVTLEVNDETELAGYLRAGYVALPKGETSKEGYTNVTRMSIHNPKIVISADMTEADAKKAQKIIEANPGVVFIESISDVSSAKGQGTKELSIDKYLTGTSVRDDVDLNLVMDTYVPGDSIKNTQNADLWRRVWGAAKKAGVLFHQTNSPYIVLTADKIRELKHDPAEMEAKKAKNILQLFGDFLSSETVQQLEADPEATFYVAANNAFTELTAPDAKPINHWNPAMHPGAEVQEVAESLMRYQNRDETEAFNAVIAEYDTIISEEIDKEMEAKDAADSADKAAHASRIADLRSVRKMLRGNKGNQIEFVSNFIEQALGYNEATKQKGFKRMADASGALGHMLFKTQLPVTETLVNYLRDLKDIEEGKFNALDILNGASFDEKHKLTPGFISSTAKAEPVVEEVTAAVKPEGVVKEEEGVVKEEEVAAEEPLEQGPVEELTPQDLFNKLASFGSLTVNEVNLGVNEDTGANPDTDFTASLRSFDSDDEVEAQSETGIQYGATDLHVRAMRSYNGILNVINDIAAKANLPIGATSNILNALKAPEVRASISDAAVDANSVMGFLRPQENDPWQLTLMKVGVKSWLDKAEEMAAEGTANFGFDPKVIVREVPMDTVRGFLRTMADAYGQNVVVINKEGKQVTLRTVNPGDVLLSRFNISLMDRGLITPKEEQKRVASILDTVHPKLSKAPVLTISEASQLLRDADPQNVDNFVAALGKYLAMPVDTHYLLNDAMMTPRSPGQKYSQMDELLYRLFKLGQSLGSDKVTNVPKVITGQLLAESRGAPSVLRDIFGRDIRFMTQVYAVGSTATGVVGTSRLMTRAQEMAQQIDRPYYEFMRMGVGYQDTQLQTEGDSRTLAQSPEVMMNTVTSLWEQQGEMWLGRLGDKDPFWFLSREAMDTRLPSNNTWAAQVISDYFEHLDQLPEETRNTVIAEFMPGDTRESLTDALNNGTAGFREYALAANIFFAGDLDMFKNADDLFKRLSQLSTNGSTIKGTGHGAADQINYLLLDTKGLLDVLDPQELEQFGEQNLADLLDGVNLMNPAMGKRIVKLLGHQTGWRNPQDPFKAGILKMLLFKNALLKDMSASNSLFLEDETPDTGSGRLAASDETSAREALVALVTKVADNIFKAAPDVDFIAFGPKAKMVGQRLMPPSEWTAFSEKVSADINTFIPYFIPDVTGSDVEVIQPLNHDTRPHVTRTPVQTIANKFMLILKNPAEATAYVNLLNSIVDKRLRETPDPANPDNLMKALRLDARKTGDTSELRMAEEAGLYSLFGDNAAFYAMQNALKSLFEHPAYTLLAADVPSKYRLNTYEILGNKFRLAEIQLPKGDYRKRYVFDSMEKAEHAIRNNPSFFADLLVMNASGEFVDNEGKPIQLSDGKLISENTQDVAIRTSELILEDGQVMIPSTLAVDERIPHDGPQSSIFARARTQFSDGAGAVASVSEAARLLRGHDFDGDSSQCTLMMPSADGAYRFDDSREGRINRMFLATFNAVLPGTEDRFEDAAANLRLMTESDVEAQKKEYIKESWYVAAKREAPQFTARIDAVRRDNPENPRDALIAAIPELRDKLIVKYKPFTPQWMGEMNKRETDGKKALGIAARFNSAIPFLRYVGARPKEVSAEKFEAITDRAWQEFKAEFGSALVNLTVDNTKDPSLHRLGLNVTTVPLFLSYAYVEFTRNSGEYEGNMAALRNKALAFVNSKEMLRDTKEIKVASDRITKRFFNRTDYLNDATNRKRFSEAFLALDEISQGIRRFGEQLDLFLGKSTYYRDSFDLQRRLAFRTTTDMLPSKNMVVSFPQNATSLQKNVQEFDAMVQPYLDLDSVTNVNGWRSFTKVQTEAAMGILKVFSIESLSDKLGIGETIRTPIPTDFETVAGYVQDLRAKYAGNVFVSNLLPAQAAYDFRQYGLTREQKEQELKGKFSRAHVIRFPKRDRMDEAFDTELLQAAFDEMDIRDRATLMYLGLAYHGVRSGVGSGNYMSFVGPVTRKLLRQFDVSSTDRLNALMAQRGESFMKAYKARRPSAMTPERFRASGLTGASSMLSVYEGEAPKVGSVREVRTDEVPENALYSSDTINEEQKLEIDRTRGSLQLVRTMAAVEDAVKQYLDSTGRDYVEYVKADGSLHEAVVAEEAAEEVLESRDRGQLDFPGFTASLADAASPGLISANAQQPNLMQGALQHERELSKNTNIGIGSVFGTQQDVARAKLEQAAALAGWVGPDGKGLRDETIEAITGYNKKTGEIQPATVYLPGTIENINNPLREVYLPTGTARLYRDHLGRMAVYTHDTRWVNSFGSRLLSFEYGKPLYMRFYKNKQSLVGSDRNNPIVMETLSRLSALGAVSQIDSEKYESNEYAIHDIKGALGIDIAAIAKAVETQLTETEKQVYWLVMASQNSVTLQLHPNVVSASTTVDIVGVRPFSDLVTVMSEIAEAQISDTLKNHQMNGAQYYSIEDSGEEAGTTWIGIDIQVGPTKAEADKMMADTLEFLDGVLPNSMGIKILDSIYELLPDIGAVFSKGGLSFVLDTPESWKSGPADESTAAYIQYKGYGFQIHVNPDTPPGLARLHSALHELGHFIDHRYLRDSRGALLSNDIRKKEWEPYALQAVLTGLDDTADFVREAYTTEERKKKGTQNAVYASEYWAETMAYWLIDYTGLVRPLGSESDNIISPNSVEHMVRVLNQGLEGFAADHTSEELFKEYDAQKMDDPTTVLNVAEIANSLTLAEVSVPRAALSVQPKFTASLSVADVEGGTVSLNFGFAQNRRGLDKIRNWMRSGDRERARMRTTFSKAGISIEEGDLLLAGMDAINFKRTDDVDEAIRKIKEKVLPKLEVEAADKPIYEKLSVNKGEGEYKEYFIKLPFEAPGEHGAFQDPNLMGWFRTRAMPDGSLDVQEIQSELFQKNKGGFLATSIIDTPAQRALNDLFDEQRGFSAEQAAFLNAMLKDQTWVPTFVNAIAQWARQQGFEKVRFPTGETAAKVEGHQVLADRLKELQEERRAAIASEAVTEFTASDGNKFQRSQLGDWTVIAPQTGERVPVSLNEAAFAAAKIGLNLPTSSTTVTKIDAEIKQIKTQGIEKLAPIEAFYENRVGSIVNKMGAVPVTDANGNTWREIDLRDQDFTASLADAASPNQLATWVNQATSPNKDNPIKGAIPAILKRYRGAYLMSDTPMGRAAYLMGLIELNDKTKKRGPLEGNQMKALVEYFRRNPEYIPPEQLNVQPVQPRQQEFDFTAAPAGGDYNQPAAVNETVYDKFTAALTDVPQLEVPNLTSSQRQYFNEMQRALGHLKASFKRADGYWKELDNLLPFQDNGVLVDRNTNKKIKLSSNDTDAIRRYLWAVGALMDVRKDSKRPFTDYLGYEMPGLVTEDRMGDPVKIGEVIDNFKQSPTYQLLLDSGRTEAELRPQRLAQQWADRFDNEYKILSQFVPGLSRDTWMQFRKGYFPHRFGKGFYTVERERNYQELLARVTGQRVPQQEWAALEREYGFELQKYLKSNPRSWLTLDKLLDKDKQNLLISKFQTLEDDLIRMASPSLRGSVTSLRETDENILSWTLPEYMSRALSLRWRVFNMAHRNASVEETEEIEATHPYRIEPHGINLVPGKLLTFGSVARWRQKALDYIEETPGLSSKTLAKINRLLLGQTSKGRVKNALVGTVLDTRETSTEVAPQEGLKEKLLEQFNQDNAPLYDEKSGEFEMPKTGQKVRSVGSVVDRMLAVEDGVKFDPADTTEVRKLRRGYLKQARKELFEAFNAVKAAREQGVNISVSSPMVQVAEELYDEGNLRELIGDENRGFTLYFHSDLSGKLLEKTHARLASLVDAVGVTADGEVRTINFTTKLGADMSGGNTTRRGARGVATNRFITELLHAPVAQLDINVHHNRPVVTGKMKQEGEQLLKDSQWLRELKVLDEDIASIRRFNSQFRESATHEYEGSYPTFLEAYQTAGLLPQDLNPAIAFSNYVREMYKAAVNKSLVVRGIISSDEKGAPLVVAIPYSDANADHSTFGNKDNMRYSARRTANYFNLPYDEALTPEENLQSFETTVQDSGEYEKINFRTFDSVKTMYVLSTGGPTGWGANVKQAMRMALSTPFKKQYPRFLSSMFPSLERRDWLEDAMKLTQTMKFINLSASLFFGFSASESFTASMGPVEAAKVWANPVKGFKSYLDFRNKALTNTLPEEVQTRLDRLIRNGFSYDVTLDPTIVDLGVPQQIVQGLERQAMKGGKLKYGYTGLAKLFKGQLKLSEAMLGQMFPVLKLKAALTMAERIEEEKAVRGQGELSDEDYAAISRVMNDGFGGQSWDQYWWAVPATRQFMNFLMFAPNWTMSSFRIAGGNKLFEKAGIGPRVTGLEADFMRKYYWPSMAIFVVAAVPNLIQSMLWAVTRPLGGDDDDKPFTFQNEAGKKFHIDITPLMRVFPWYTGASTGERRVYARWGKQVYEVYDTQNSWFADAINLKMTTIQRKLSTPARIVLEQITGNIGGTDWDADYKSMGLAGIVYGEKDGIFGSRLASIAKSALPFSLSSLLRGSEAGPLGMLVSTSKGASQGGLTNEMVRVLTTYANSDAWNKIKKNPNAKANLAGLAPAIVDSALRNGYDPKVIITTARGAVLRELYAKAFDALDREDYSDFEDYARRIMRVNGTLQTMISHIKSRRERFTAPQEPLNQDQIAALREAFQ